jgi:phosphoesterase RecJ-like protein
MPHADNIIIYDNEPEVAKETVSRADIIYCLDFNALDRIDKLGEDVADQNVPMVLIDHHLDPDPFADYELSDITASSTSELVYFYMEYSKAIKELDKDIASCLYTGIITDTGSFKYSTSPRLFRVVSHLLETGVDDYDIQDKIHNSYTEKQLRLLGHCIFKQDGDFTRIQCWHHCFNKSGL